MIEMQETLQAAFAYSVLVIATVEAIRKRIAFDGWRVLLVAAGVSLALGAMYMPDAELATLRDALRTSALAWLLAVGGDAWVTKLRGSK